MKVYVVLQDTDCGYSYSIEDIFTTEKGAQDYIGSTRSSYNNFIIEEYEVKE